LIHQGKQNWSSHLVSPDSDQKQMGTESAANTHNFPLQSSLRTRQFQHKPQLFDVFRRKWVADTPEERVRQELLRRLTGALGYPAQQFSIERRVQHATGQRSSGGRLAQPAQAGNSRGRYDALLRTREGIPLLLIECKAPCIALDQSVFDQAAVYNYSLNVPFLLLSNGPDFLMAQIDYTQGRYVFAPEIPNYSTLIALIEEKL